MNLKYTSIVCGCLTLSCLASTVSASEYYRRATKQEKQSEHTGTPSEFVWTPLGQQLIYEMAIDYQNALYVINSYAADDSEKSGMQEFMQKYPAEFGIRSTKAVVISSIDQFESSFDLIKDTIIPSGMRQDGFFYDPNDKPQADSLMADLRLDSSSVAGYRGRYYEVWQFNTDSSGVKSAIVFTPLGLQSLKVLTREEANIKTDFSELKNQFSNAEDQRKEIANARKEHPDDYGQVLGEEYQWNLCQTWRDIVVKPTPTEEELAAAKTPAPKVKTKKK